LNVKHEPAFEPEDPGAVVRKNTITMTRTFDILD
jgi:hypothetical protein